MSSNFEFFKKQVELTGKHARMARELWQRDHQEATYFKRLIDLYKMAPAVGYLSERKAVKDSGTEETATIFLEQINREKEFLENIMTMILMAEYADSGLYKKEEAVKEAFRGPQTQEAYEQCVEIFESYVRGGIEVLYEELVLKQSIYENRYSSHRNTGALMGFLEQWGLSEEANT